MEIKAPVNYVDHIVELAKTCVTEYPINWGDLSVSEDEAYKLVALGVLELLDNKFNTEEGKDIMLSTIVSLMVENFSLNLQLLQKDKEL
jgi:hypothetical protein